MVSFFTSSPTLPLQVPKRQTGETTSLIPARKFPEIQDDFLDALPQQDLENKLEQVISKMLSLQAKVVFYNQRFQAQDPKCVEVWGHSYRQCFEDNEIFLRKLIQSVQELEKGVDGRKNLIGQRLTDMRFLRAFTQEEWVGNTSLVSWGSTVPSWQTRYGVTYRMSQIEKRIQTQPIEPSKTRESLKLETSGSTSTEIPSLVVGTKGKDSDPEESQVFAQLQDVIGRLAGLKEYALVYQHAFEQQPHTEVVRSAYLFMQQEQSSLQKKIATLEETIKNVKNIFATSLVTERLLNTPDVPLLEEKLRRLDTWQAHLQKRFEEVSCALSLIREKFTLTEEQLKAPVTITLSGLSESEILREVVALKEELEIAGQDKSVPPKELVEHWQKKNSSLKDKIAEKSQNYQRYVKAIGDQEKVLEKWQRSIEDLRKQMQLTMDKLSLSMKDRQAWKPILSPLKPLSVPTPLSVLKPFPVERDEVETPRATYPSPVFDLTKTLVQASSSSSSTDSPTSSLIKATATSSSDLAGSGRVAGISRGHENQGMGSQEGSDYKESKKKNSTKKKRS